MSKIAAAQAGAIRDKCNNSPSDCVDGRVRLDSRNLTFPRIFFRLPSATRSRLNSRLTQPDYEDGVSVLRSAWHMTGSRIVIATVAGSLGSSGVAHTESCPVGADPLDIDRVANISGALALISVDLAIMFGTNPPKTCAWCTPDAFDGAMADSLAWRNTGLADDLSYGTLALSLAPSLVMLAGDSSHVGWGQVADDATAIGASVGVTMFVTEIVQRAIARERPFVFHSVPETSMSSYAYGSFFSDLTSIAFSLASSTGWIASQRGYDDAAEIWIAGLGFAAATGYLRIAADKHWTTDVLAGAGVGSAIGYFLPRAMRAQFDAVPRLRVSLSTDGISVAGMF